MLCLFCCFVVGFFVLFLFVCLCVGFFFFGGVGVGGWGCQFMARRIRPNNLRKKNRVNK